MAAKLNSKRRGGKQASGSASKKRKLDSAGGTQPKKQATKASKGKDHAFDRKVIPIPALDNDDNVAASDVSEEDVDVLKNYGAAASFLGNLDRTGIARSKKETDRLHRLNKPIRKPIIDDLPSLHSDDSDDNPDDDDLLNLSVEDEDFSESGSDEEIEGNDELPRSSNVSETEGGINSDDSDAEMPYEVKARKRRPSWDEEESNEAAVRGLPIKLKDGRVQPTGKVSVLHRSEAAENPPDNDSVDEEDIRAKYIPPPVEDVSTGARFGRPAVVDVIGMKSRKAAILAAKEQIAALCQDIISDPENSLGLVRRLHTFSLAKVSTPSHPEPVVNDVVIRKLAFLSQLAVFKDVIPGYRIRPLTDKEKAEKVSQLVARTREWEQGLVQVYQSYLRSLEAELKAKSELADIALQCLCTLAVEATHFNYRQNIFECIVSRLSKKTWDNSSELCSNALTRVFRTDLTGEPSLEIVRLLNRMIKERRFAVHPEVLRCLLHLRLKTELGVRASDTGVDKPLPKIQSKGKAAQRRAKGKTAEQPHLSKKARKALKENKEIQRELKEAEAEVDKEQRTSTQTETLKLLFVLYFRIIKQPRPMRLLPAALRGISKYAHQVNIDFFKDLMGVLKTLIAYRPDEQGTATAESEGEDDLSNTDHMHHRLLCIVTAFELLSGQGEALDIDLDDFINQLYALILPLSLMADIDVVPDPPRQRSASTPNANGSSGSSSSSNARSKGTTGDGIQPPSVGTVLFRALHLVFSPRTRHPAWRSAAFAKRLLTASLNWPAALVLQTLALVRTLLGQEPKLEGLLPSADNESGGAGGGGVYRPDVDDPQVCNAFGTSWWELYALRDHWDANVREEAGRLCVYSRI